MKTFYIICIAFAIISCDNITNKNENLNEADFPIAGTWYVNDNGEAYTDNTLNFSEYTFGEPDQSGGKKLGKLRLVSFKGEEREGEYEIIDKNVLVIYLLNENDFTFTYTYFPDDKKLEMNYAGQERTLVREKPLTEAEIQDQLWMDKIADVDWVNNTLKMRFDKPTREGSVIKGNVDIYHFGEIFHCKYERSSGGQTTLQQTKETMSGAKLSGGLPFEFKMLLDKENILTYTNEYNNTTILRRK